MLLAQLKRETGLCLIFISHDLALVRALCERVLVMYLGRMMELAPADALYTHPRHPYTHELLRAMPSTDPQVQPQRLTRRARRGAALAAAAPERLRLPHALPPGAAAVRRAHTALGRNPRGPLCGLPPLAGAAARLTRAAVRRPRGRYCPRQLLFFGS